MKAMENDEMIREYLEGSLKGDVLKDFENRMKEDATLAKEVKDLKEVILGLKSLGVDKLKEEVGEWEKEYRNSIPENKGKVRSLSIVYSVAASIVVLVVAGIYFYSFNTPDYQSLYAENFTPYEDMILARGEEGIADEELLSEGMTAYNEQQYDLAINKLSDYLSNNPEKYGVAFYIGLAQLELNNIEEAIANFKIAQKDPLFLQQAQWYQALSYLKSEQLDQAKNILQLVEDQNSHYKREAAGELLKDIK